MSNFGILPDLNNDQGNEFEERKMKMNLNRGLFGVVFLLLSAETLAQDYDYHPALSDRFDASLGWFKSDNTFKISADPLYINTNTNIDFGDDLGVEQSNTLFDAQLRWKLGSERKWSLSGQYFKNKASGDAVLEEDVEWQGEVFREGSFVGAGVSLEVIRLFLGRSIVKNERNDFGIGVGLHYLSLDAYIEGEILINDEDTGFHRGDASSSAPLPNLGAWYMFSPAKNWLLRARVDWISANIGDYDGTLWNANVGVNYQLFRHIGLGLSYQYFNLNLGVDNNNWKGSADMTYSGPVIAVTGNW